MQFLDLHEVPGSYQFDPWYDGPLEMNRCAKINVRLHLRNENKRSSQTILVYRNCRRVGWVD